MSNTEYKVLRVDADSTTDELSKALTEASQGGWKLIVNKQTCQWGSEYDARQDLGRVDMATAPPPPDPVETFNIVLKQHFRGPVRAEDASLSRIWDLHLIWEDTDVYVSIAPLESVDVGAASPQ